MQDAEPIGHEEEISVSKDTVISEIISDRPDQLRSRRPAVEPGSSGDPVIKAFSIRPSLFQERAPRPYPL